MSSTVNPGTFTRATEATYHDHEGLIRTAKSGQARMVGSRVVENLITASEDMTNAAYATRNGGAVDSATQATFDGTANSDVYQSFSIVDDGSPSGSRAFVFSAYVRLVSGTVSSNSAVQLVLEGAAINNSLLSIGTALSSTFQRFSVLATNDGAGTGINPTIRVDDAVTLEITKWQVEEVTGQTNQNPSEYVSTGVLSGTYHGLGVDGVKAFSTLNGNTVSSGVVTEATGLPLSSSPTNWVDSDGPLGYLVEESRENILLQSNSFDTTWTNTNSVETANYAVAPDGTKTAWRLIDDSAGSGDVAIRLTQLLTVSSGSTTFSIYAKKDQLDFLALREFGFDNTDASSFFDLANGVVGTINANHTAQMESAGNGWYRCSITFNTTGVLSGELRIHACGTDGDLTEQDDGTSSILIWGAQVEAGAFPTSYIPTTTTAVTRNADVLTYSATGVADSFPMTASVEATARQIGVQGQFLSADESGSSNDRFFVTQLASGLARGGLVDTTNQATIDTTGTLTPGVPFKLAFAMNANDFEIYKDGVSEATDTSGTATIAPDTIRIGMRFDDTLQANGTIRKVKIFNKRLNDSLIENL